MGKLGGGGGGRVGWKGRGIEGRTYPEARAACFPDSNKVAVR